MMNPKRGQLSAEAKKNAKAGKRGEKEHVTTGNIGNIRRVKYDNER